MISNKYQLGDHDETVYIYKHSPSDQFACTAASNKLYYSTVLPSNESFYTNADLCKLDLLNSIDRNGDYYAKENFLEFELHTYRITLTTYISKFKLV